jgi:hypothetical protein
MQAQLEGRLEDAAHESMSKLVGSAPAAVGIKLMYDQIPDRFRTKFAHWVGCNNVTIVHLVRESAVESFWSLQARLVDTLVSGKYTDRSFDVKDQEKMHSNKAALVGIGKTRCSNPYDPYDPYDQHHD